MIIEKTGPASLKIFAPAKLNLFLEVTGKRPDGYHDLETIMHSIDLYDILEIERTNSSTCFNASGRNMGPVKQNLALKAALLFSERLGKNYSFNINLKKNIPVGAGLGGGIIGLGCWAVGMQRTGRQTNV